MKWNRLENLDRLLDRSSPEPILVVDDEPRLCQGIQQILASVGLESTAVHSVADAMEALKQRLYCLVLLDLNMPGAHGTELLDYINQQKTDTCVIVVSGEKQLKTAVDVIKNGARDYIKKPFNPDELLIAIKNALENRKLETENRRIVEELKRSEALHRFIVHNSPDLLYIVDQNGYFTFINNNVTKLLGYTRKDVIGKHFSDFVSAVDRNRA